MPKCFFFFFLPEGAFCLRGGGVGQRGIFAGGGLWPKGFFCRRGVLVGGGFCPEGFFFSCSRFSTFIYRDSIICIHFYVSLQRLNHLHSFSAFLYRDSIICILFSTFLYRAIIAYFSYFFTETQSSIYFSCIYSQRLNHLYTFLTFLHRDSIIICMFFYVSVEIQ